jgi:hypothetical protein
VFGPEHGVDKVWHMGRLILSEDSPHNSESRLIGASLREIERTRPDVWAVLTYAATDAGHIGYVYQATNALYIGAAVPIKFYVDDAGNRRGSHQGGGWVSRSEAKSRGWSINRGGLKHRYVYILGSKTQRRQRRALLKYDVLPYPKK